MLSFLRRKKNSPVIVFFLGAIIVVFVLFFGNQFNQCAGDSFYAAKVNGRTISDTEYASRYAEEFQGRQRQNQKYDRTRAQQENLRETVLNSMISETLLAQEARARGLAVDDEALKDRIKEMFQTEGRFDKKFYERYLGSRGMSDYRFESQLREALLAEKINLIANKSISVSESEAKEQFFKDRRRVDVAFIAVKKQPYEAKVGTVTQADADEWMKKEGAEDEIKKYYTKHSRTKYNVPKQVCAQHILVRNDKTLGPQKIKEAEDKISAARKAVVGDNMDFGEAAKKFSDDSTKDRGGDLGCFGAGQMVPPFEEAAFSLKAGEVSGVVETPFGFHIIKVNNIKDPVEKKLDDVKGEIALEILASVKAGEMARARAEAILAAAKTTATLDEALAKAKDSSDPAPLKVEETGQFQQRDFVPKLGLAKEVSQAAWKLTTEAPLPEKPLETETSWVVIRLKERVEPAAEEFDKEKNLTLLTMSYQKRNEAIKGWNEHLRKQAKIDVNPVVLSYDENVRQNAKNQQQRSF